MKKLNIPEFEDGQQYFADQVILANTVNQLIDLVNSQQEAIEDLERRLGDVDSLDGSFNLWGRDIDKRLRKVEAESKAMGEALVTHYNRPDAHKPIPEEPLDDKPENKNYKLVTESEPFDRVEYEKAKFVRDREKVRFAGFDTHRTVTLRIPKGMTFVESLFYADLSLNMSDNEAQKALDEVQPNE